MAVAEVAVAAAVAKWQMQQEQERTKIEQTVYTWDSCGNDTVNCEL